METFVCFVNAITLGMLIPLTLRWLWLHYSVYKLKSNQRGPLDRTIEITSDEILKGVIRKRQKQTSLIMNSSNYFDLEELNDKPKSIPQVTSFDIGSIYNSFKKKGVYVYLIPNEDIHIALKKDLLSDLSKYLFNDEISNILYNIELNKNKNLKKQEELIRAQLEEKKKLRERQIEDSIKI